MMVTQSKAIEALLSKTEKEKQTNFQRITKTPEALAEFIASFHDGVPAILLFKINNPLKRKNVSDWLTWLKQESK